MDDTLEDNLLKCFGPIHFWQNILASIRVRIKNKVVTNTTVWQTVYSLIWLVLVTLSSSYFQFFYYNAYYHEDMLLYIICFFGTISENISYALNLLINRFTQRENNIKIYTMLQKVDRLFQMEKYHYYTDFQNRFNKLSTFMIVVGFLSGFAVHAFSVLTNPSYTVFYAVGLLTIFMDIVLGAGMLHFLATRMSVFNMIIKNYIKEYKENAKRKPKVKTIKKMILSLVKPNVQENSLKLTHDKWLECLKEVLRCYKIITGLFSFTIFNLSVTVLIWTFLVIGAMVVGYRGELYPLFASITLVLWAAFYYLLLTITAIINDWFIMEVKKTKLLCIRLISYDYDGPYQKVASEMIRVIHYDTPIFVVYGIFVLDRRLPLEIIGVIASNVLVLIQFVI